MKKHSDANHEGLAHGFDSMAIDERRRISRFLGMAAQYESMGGPAIAHWQLDRHCRDLAATAEKPRNHFKGLPRRIALWLAKREVVDHQSCAPCLPPRAESPVSVRCLPRA